MTHSAAPSTVPDPSGGGPGRNEELKATGAAFGAEIVGTFILVFCGTATVLAVHLMSSKSGFTVPDDIAISLAFALGIVAAVYTTASISGAHINPAVTIGLAVIGKFPWREVPVYLGAQFIGGILAGLVNLYLFGGRVPDSLILGSTAPGDGIPLGVAMFTEFVITLILMVVVMATAVFERAPGGARTAGLSIGLWIGAAIFLSLPVSGGSLNPARTIGPDIVAGQFPYWWIYFVGPIVGAAAGAALWRFVLGKGSKETVEQAG